MHQKQVEALASYEDYVFLEKNSIDLLKLNSKIMEIMCTGTYK